MIIESNPKEVLVAKYYNLELRLLKMKDAYEEYSVDKLNLNDGLYVDDIRKFVDTMNTFSKLIVELRQLRGLV